MHAYIHTYIHANLSICLIKLMPKHHAHVHMHTCTLWACVLTCLHLPPGMFFMASCTVAPMSTRIVYFLVCFWCEACCVSKSTYECARNAVMQNPWVSLWWCCLRIYASMGKVYVHIHGSTRSFFTIHVLQCSLRCCCVRMHASTAGAFVPYTWLHQSLLFTIHVTQCWLWCITCWPWISMALCRFFFPSPSLADRKRAQTRCASPL